MHPLEVSVIAGLIFVIIAILVDCVMINTLGFKSSELTSLNQYILTFMTAFIFSLLIEYTELNDLVCSGNH